MLTSAYFDRVRAGRCLAYSVVVPPPLVPTPLHELIERVRDGRSALFCGAVPPPPSGGEMALFKVVAGAVNGGAGNPGQVVECMEGEQFLASDLLVEKVRVPVRPGQVARLVISLQTNPLGAAESVTFSVAVDGVSSAQTITVVPATPLNTPQTMGVSPVVAVGSARLSLLANAAAFTSVADPLRFTASWEYQPTTFNG